MRTAVMVLVVASVMSVGAAQAADRFVSTKGNNDHGANPCNPLPCKTVRQALAQAASGDIIKVAKGTYKGSAAITTGGTWTIRGGYGADFSETARDVVKNKTTLSGDTNRRFLFIHAETGEAITVTLDGLTVSNSRSLFSHPDPPLAGVGGGIAAFADAGGIQLNLNNVTLTGNKSDEGGALFVEAEGNGSVVAHITASLFKSNIAGQLSGGAIAALSAVAGTVNLTIEDTRFEGNKAFSGGAIIMESDGNTDVTATIRRSLFLKNSAARLEGSSIGTGGAIEIISNDFNAGGGSSSAGLTMENCILQANQAGRGGAIAARTSISDAPLPQGTARVSLDLRNNTIVANRASHSFGAGIISTSRGANGAPVGSSTVTGTLLNNIISGNTVVAAFLSFSDIVLLPAPEDGASTSFDLITNNIGFLANFGTLTATPDPQLNVSPQLVKKQGVYRLGATSPMINAGTCAGAPADDYEGNARPDGSGLCDIGADEI
jgi:hypothetical protein